jgi:macrolide-specific efflux system membrane fusion protein
MKLNPVPVIVLLFYLSLINQGPVLGQTSGTGTTAASQHSIEEQSIEGQVPAPISGVVQNLHIREGDRVALGQPLAEWDSILLQSEYAAALAALAAARAESDQSIDQRYAQLTAEVRQAEMKRSVQANTAFEKTVSSVELARQELLIQQAKLSSEQSLHKQHVLEQSALEKKAVAELAKTKLDRSKLFSRINGVVTELLVRPGQWTPEGSPIARIINLERVRFEAMIDWQIAKRLQPGTAVHFRPRVVAQTAESKTNDSKSVPTPVYPGEIIFVSPEINPVTHQVRLIAEISNPLTELQPGQDGRLSIAR